jgi:hypothetical protein
MRHSLFLKKTILFTKRLLWVSSLVFVTVWLLQTRSSVQSVKNVDRYFAALQQNDVVYATTLLETYPMEEEYLQKCLYNLNEEESMFPQTLQCGLNSALAITNSNAESRVLDFLERGAVPNEETLEVALSKDYPRVVLFCLKHGVKGKETSLKSALLNRVSSRLINTVYDTESSAKWYECMEILLNNKVNVDSLDLGGQTSLYYFVKEQGMSEVNQQAVASLIKYGADVNKKIKNKYLLQKAVENHNVSNVEMLLQAGAKPNFYLNLWQSDNLEEHYGMNNTVTLYETDNKVTLFSKVLEMCNKGDAEKQEDYRKILALLKQYGAKEKL